MKIKNKKFYNKNDIHEFIKQNKEFKTIIYQTVKDMMIEKKYDMHDGDTVADFTDGLYNAKNYICYFINNEKYPELELYSNIAIIDYNQDDLPISIYLDNSWGEFGKCLYEMVNKTIAYMNSNR